MFDNISDTFLKIKCVTSRALQNKNTKKELGKENYDKLLRLFEKLQKADYKNDDLITLYDNGVDIVFEKTIVEQ